ncbi:MAG: type II toxin-antitoxin system RelE/ParE family toxin [Cellulosilyticaceae bacterium]
MNIFYSKVAVKMINSMDKPTKQRIRNGILGLIEVPPKGDIKNMQGIEGMYRLRIGKYRILYEYKKDDSDNMVLHIVDVGSRGDIYK